MQEDIAAPAIGEASDVNPSVATAPVEERTAGRHGVRRRRVLAWCSIVVGVLAAAALAAAAFVRLPYVIILPGEATALDHGVVRIDGARTYPHRGDVLYLTVRISNRDPTIYRWLFAHLDSDATIEKRQDVIGCATYDESQRLAQYEMEASQDIAKTVALTELGYEIPADPARAVIVNVACGGPSAGKLELGDVIRAIDGHTVTTAEDARSLVVAHRPGDLAVVTVDRAGATRDVRVRLGARDGVALLGIEIRNDVRHRIPFDIAIDTRRVSGPSAGLAFTLAIIDELTPGDLTGGRPVAVTGTIGPDGSIGVVGGVAQKAVTARRNGVRLMLVPAAEAKAALAHADGMKVVGVRTLDDALAALHAAGGATVTTIAGDTLNSQ